MQHTMSHHICPPVIPRPSFLFNRHIIQPLDPLSQPPPVPVFPPLSSARSYPLAVEPISAVDLCMTTLRQHPRTVGCVARVTIHDCLGQSTEAFGRCRRA